MLWLVVAGGWWLVATILAHLFPTKSTNKSQFPSSCPSDSSTASADLLFNSLSVTFLDLSTGNDAPQRYAISIKPEAQIFPILSTRNNESVSALRPCIAACLLFVGELSVTLGAVPSTIEGRVSHRPGNNRIRATPPPLHPNPLYNRSHYKSPTVQRAMRRQ